ncbi:phospho-N-acetylmuramoyl-pentapeptide-transferase [Anaerosporobacter faecicola]|uniref:phospho-N-acetylmuramoyl-pentapeptide- transferase n=1 Tax=Anaerosporobacter faecicola TaxID=2718714 RepID=UPI00143BC03C|nr:phospho-N-acetylmuramoyl-pentapeptide-transferase [Anaerosporobacter faecicola]
MYKILSNYLNVNQIVMIGIVFAFCLTFLALKHPFPFLPTDKGRDYAVNGKLSKGKIRGVGLTFVICFLVSSFLFLPFDREYVIYAILLTGVMLSGYLDDASETPWNEYKKGLIDLILALITVLTFIDFNSTTIYIGTMELIIPKILYVVLGIILFWVSINVTNCTDGVDGLSASIASIVLLSFSIIFSQTLGKYAMANFLFVAVLLAYLYFNTSPSSMLMGDAGSRAMGYFIAIIAIKTQHPLIYLLLAGVFIIDGGLGLVKVSLLRFLKIRILKNTLTPIHDHVRKNHHWSDTQVVVRFMIIQVLLAIIAYVVVC